MKVHCIRHESFEDVGCIKEWIINGNHKLTYTHIFLNEQFPVCSDFDFLIIMGGSASVYDTNKYPWLIDEIKLIKEAINNNKKILGICLGAQLVAKTLGADIYPGIQKEIGWFPVKFNKANLQTMSFLPEVLTTFHWHGDTFNLPDGAIRLAASDNTPVQGFIYGKNVVALQFHPEMTSESIEIIIEAAGHELTANGEYIQSAKQILEQNGFIFANNQLMLNLLEYLTVNSEQSTVNSQ
jgi:GMP synthase (glutamine-hydrolysing)